MGSRGEAGVTRSKALPLAVLVAASVLLVSSVAWAVARDDRGGWSMMRYGPGMMGYADAGGGEPVEGLDAAARQARRFAEPLDLRVGEVMRFSNHYYAELVEQDGRGATEVLVDPRTGAVWLEPGPAMMWNTRYGMMSGRGMMGRDGGGMMGRDGGGMMGGGWDGDGAWAPRAERRAGRPSVGSGEARRLARRWLDADGGGLTAEEPEAFPGYFTLHLAREGRVTGMLSVNARTGAVWPHWWHGRFVAMTESPG